MNSSIYIDGAALWVLLLLAAALFAGFIFFGCSYIAEARENDRLKAKLKKYLNILREREIVEPKSGIKGDLIFLDIIPPKFPKGGDHRG